MRSKEGIERWSRWQAGLYGLVSPNPRSNREIVDLAAPGPDDRVLDVGCGPGAAVRLAAATGATVIGVDPSAAMVDLARRRSKGVGGVRFEVGDAASLPLDDDAVTLAWAVASFHHWPDQRAGLEELHRVLAPRGRLFLGERRVRRRGHGLSRAQVDELMALLADLGYRNVRTTSRRLRLFTMVVVEGVA